MVIKLILLIIPSYLLGSIPFGYIIVKFLGKGDIRNFGSGNIGMSNVSRIIGTAGGLFVLLLDVAKGFVATYIAYTYIPEVVFFLLLCPLFAVIGHIFPIFLKFKGGKGVATSFGSLLYISPSVAVILLGIWAVSVFISRISSIGSLLSAIFISPLLFLLNYELNEICFGAILTIIIFLTHIENIKRLIKGEELKI